MKRQNMSRRLASILLWLVSALFALYFIIPFYWAANASLKSDSQLAMTPATFLPRDPASNQLRPTLQNYTYTLHQPAFWTGLRNSAIVATTATVTALLLGMLAAYALARLTFRGMVVIRYLILSMTMFPQIILLTGLFSLARVLGLPALLNLTLADMLLTLPLITWLLTAHVRRFPDELLDSARLEGATVWQLFRFVLIPLLAPSMLATGLIAFIMVWNEYLFALVLTVLDVSSRPITVVMVSAGAATGAGTAMAIMLALITLLPAVLFQRRIISGLMQSSGAF